MKKLKTFPKIYIFILLIIMYIPIALVIIYSFNESKINAIWSGFSWKWYVELFNDKSYFEALMNSLYLATASSLSAAVIGTLGACGMKKVKLRSKGVVEYVSTLPIMIPEIVLGMVFLSFFALLGMPFGMTTLIIAHTTFCVPYIFMQVNSRLVGLDKSLEESARDLGAGQMRAFFDITLPLIAPAVASGMLLSFAMSLDDVIISVFVTGADVNLLPLKIYTQLKGGLSPKVNALCSLMFVATVLLCTVSAIISAKSTNKSTRRK